MIKKIGFIGQGWIGRNYADWYEKQGWDLVRYGLEPQFADNKAAIATCDAVFIAVPTPTTPKGFDDSIAREAVALVGENKIAIIKSTILPGTTRSIQEQYPTRLVLFSPEFLTEATAAYDVANPDRSIVGWVSDEGQSVCGDILKIMPPAPYEAIVKAEEAEVIKYGGNCWFYLKVVYINMLYDISQKLGIDYEVVKNGMAADSRIGTSHLDPIHKSGRGAGGNCFIKDFEALRRLYVKEFPDDKEGAAFFSATVAKNLQLLENSNKDAGLVTGVYGEAA